MSLPRTATGEVAHPSGATRPARPHLHAVGPGVSAGTSTDRRADVELIARPDGATAIRLLAYLSELIDDPRTGLSIAQQIVAHHELDALTSDGFVDAIHEDRDTPTVELPGRAAAAALRIVVARGLLRDEWDA